MKKNSINSETALKIAIQYETNKYKLYQKTITRVKDKESLSILHFLSRQEYERIKMLKEMYQQVSGRRLMIINLNGEENIKPKLIFNLYKEPLKILDFAIQNDKESLVFYKEAADFCINPDGKKMLEYLNNQKLGHLELLKMEYQVREKDYAVSAKNGKKRFEYIFQEYDPVAEFI